MTEIDVNKTDPYFARDIMNQPGGEKIWACFSCRTCTASCPIAAINHTFNPARIIRMALYGLKQDILTSDFIWFCSNCYACQERCPQGVRITDIMTLLKNMAIQAGYMPSGIKSQMDIIKGEGRIYPIDDFDNKKRAKAGLPPLPTSCEVVKTLFS